MRNPPQRVLSANQALALPLYGAGATRALEAQLAATLPSHSLMQRAGLSVARLALAVAPHAQTIWIACGPGNNGGDGLEAALHLHAWGKQVWLTCLGNSATLPTDAKAALQRVLAAGVEVKELMPTHFDLCIDALLGLGSAQADSKAPRPIEGRMAEWIARMNAGAATVLAVDLPSGLQANTGVQNNHCVRAQHTLSLLGLQPGLFTAQGRDVCGAIWLDDLTGASALDHAQLQAQAQAQALPRPAALLSPRPPVQARPHASHKGSFGDVAILGGASGMVGAAVLAARAAHACGAGRVYVGLLAPEEAARPIAWDPLHPELMFRSPGELPLNQLTVVIGCGGGNAFGPTLAQALSQGPALVADADALNLIAQDAQLQSLLQKRQARGWATVLTPHPLEAARLLQSSTAQVQADRLAAAQHLAERFGCVLVLKGSGSVIAAPSCVPFINPTGNGSLAGAGTGDVLAGMVGAALAQLRPDRSMMTRVQTAVAHAVYRHGDTVTNWPSEHPLSASQLLHLLNKK